MTDDPEEKPSLFFRRHQEMQFRQSTLLLAVLLSVRTACAQTDLQPYGHTAPDAVFNAPTLSSNGIGESQQPDNEGIRAQLDALEAQQHATQQELNRLRQALGDSPAATSTGPYPEMTLSAEMLNTSSPWPRRRLSSLSTRKIVSRRSRHAQRQYRALPGWDRHLADARRR